MTKKRPDWSDGAITAFRQQEQGLRRLLSAADLYTIHIMARLRGVSPDPEQCAAVLTGNRVSGYAMLGASYSLDERTQLGNEGHLREVGQQVLVATYTATEGYLINKFSEYLRHKLGPEHRDLEQPIIESQRFRSLKDISLAFRKFLDISLAQYELRQRFTTEGCSFQPSSSWEALVDLSKARNEIVHQGTSTTYEVNTLADARYYFEFCRDWIESFNSNFDMLLYDNFRTDLVLEYQERLNSAP